MLVTCFTDASFAAQRGGRWAVLLRSDDGELARSGACPSTVVTSTNAELAAIAAGVQLALRTWGAQTHRIDVRSDCRAALAIADGSGRARDSVAQRLQHRIRRQLKEHGVELSCAWVKGHQPQGSGRAAEWNNRCDAMARGRRQKRV